MSSTTAAAAAVVTTPAPSSPLINLTNPGWLEYGIVIGVVAVLFLGMIFCWLRNRETILLQTADGNVRVLKSSVFDESMVKSLRLSAVMRAALTGGGGGGGRGQGNCSYELAPTSHYGDEEEQHGLMAG